MLLTLVDAERSMPSSCVPTWLVLFLNSLAAMVGGAAMRPRSRPTCRHEGGQCHDLLSARKPSNAVSESEDSAHGRAHKYEAGVLRGKTPSAHRDEAPIRGGFGRLAAGFALRHGWQKLAAVPVWSLCIH